MALRCERAGDGQDQPLGLGWFCSERRKKIGFGKERAQMEMGSAIPALLQLPAGLEEAFTAHLVSIHQEFPQWCLASV